MKKAYVSCPMTVPMNILKDVINLSIDKKLKTSWWIRGSHYGSSEEQAIEECDYFIIIPPGNKWENKISDLPNGTKSELRKAIRLCKNIYIAYTTASGYLGLYKADIDTDEKVIMGIAGTSNNIDFELEYPHTPDEIYSNYRVEKIMNINIIGEIEITTSISDPRLLFLLL